MKWWRAFVNFAVGAVAMGTFVLAEPGYPLWVYPVWVYPVVGVAFGLVVAIAVPWS